MSRDDPFERARAALDSAREARGADPEEDEPIIIDPRDPLGAAQTALERARAAREAAATRSNRARVAEATARMQLRRLKQQQGSGAWPASDGPDQPDPDGAEGNSSDGSPVDQPRKRRL